MRYLLNRGLCVVLCATVPVLAAAAQETPPAPAAPEVEVSQHAPADFAGRWDYNADESLNAATGKPEQAPRSATQRGRGTAPAPRAGAAGGRAGGGGFAGGQGRTSDIGPTPEMLRASRDLMRDLLEIPESLTVKVTSDSIAFTDDLDRTRIYPTDGTKHSYRLGGSEYAARVAWRSSQLRKDIDGEFGFKMSEVYFLSTDAKRLFVIVRVADMRRNAPPIGADRVYDRVESADAGSRTSVSR